MTKKTLESKKLEQEARERLRTSPLRVKGISCFFAPKQNFYALNPNLNKEKSDGTSLANSNTSAAN